MIGANEREKLVKFFPRFIEGGRGKFSKKKKQNFMI